jgi:DNA-binding transcriptional LysR family regulator
MLAAVFLSYLSHSFPEGHGRQMRSNFLAPAVDVRPLLGLIALAEWGTLAAAAEHLGVGRSWTSTQIQTLERSLGTRLVTRNQGAFTLTEDGLSVLGHARRVAAAQGRLLVAATAIGRGERGELRLGAARASARIPIRSRLTEEFVARFPAVDLSLSEGSSGSIWSALRTGEIDAALAVPADRRAQASSELTVLPIQVTEMVVLIPESNQDLSCRATLTPADLAGEMVATASRSVRTPSLERLIEPLESAGAIAVTTPEWHPQALVDRVRSAGVLALMADWQIPEVVPSDLERIRVVPFVHPDPPGDLCLAIRSPADNQPATDFFNLAVESVAKEKNRA